MRHYINATHTPPALMLYLAVDRSFWLAVDVKTQAIYGRFNGEFFYA